MLFVRDIMTREVKTLKPEGTLREAAKTMERFAIGALVIVGEGGRPIGIVTEGDISRAAGRGSNLDKSSVRTIASKRLVTTSPDERVEVAARMMAESKVKKLPVLEGAKLVGIVTQTDIVASSFELVTSLKEMVRARYRPPDFRP